MKLFILPVIIFSSLMTLVVPPFQGSENEPAVWYTENGRINFVSDAPLELIKASSDNLKGAINLEKRTFAFRVSNRSFKGFNSALQQEHFYENYIEANKYPFSDFKGKIIEREDFSQDGTYQVRSKGILSIHGVEQERIINTTLKKSGDTLKLQSTFTVLLKEHDIRIPRIVYQKISEEIEVEVSAVLFPKTMD